MKSVKPRRNCIKAPFEKLLKALTGENRRRVFVVFYLIIYTLLIGLFIYKALQELEKFIFIISIYFKAPLIVDSIVFIIFCILIGVFIYFKVFQLSKENIIAWCFVCAFAILCFCMLLLSEKATNMLALLGGSFTVYAMLYNAASNEHNARDRVIADLTNTAMNQLKEFKNGHLANTARKMEILEKPSWLAIWDVIQYKAKKHESLEGTQYKAKKHKSLGGPKIEYVKNDKGEFLQISAGKEIAKLPKDQWRNDNEWMKIYKALNRRPETIDSIKQFVVSMKRTGFVNKEMEAFVDDCNRKTTSVDIGEITFVDDRIKSTVRQLINEKYGEGDFVKIDPDLSDLWLHGADLSGAQFRGAYLRFAQFHGANLRDAQFHGAYLVSVQFHGAHLRDAQFQGADLDGAQFQGANLGGAKFEGASLCLAQFRGAKGSAKFEEAILHWAKFEGASLYLAQFQGASLYLAQFYGANLRDAQFHGASLYEADFQGAENIKTADFTGVKNIETACFDSREQKEEIIKRFKLTVDNDVIERYEKKDGPCDQRRKEYKKWKEEQDS